MRLRPQLSASVLGLSLLLSGAIGKSASCQESGGFKGWLHLSSRTLSLSGGSNAGEKYSEDFDYQNGIQLAGLMLQGKRGVREFGLEASGWGEDPFATFRGWYRQSGLFRLTFGGYNARYSHSNAAYQEEYNLDSSPYQYTRRGRYADLALTVGGLPDIHFRFDRFRREGTNLNVWNIEDEKHTVLSPADETATSLQIATSIPILTASVDLSYTRYSLDNNYGAVIPDTSDGLGGRPGVIYDYSHIINDSGSLPVLKANVTVPVYRARVRFGYSSSSGSIEKTMEERETGIDYSGNPVNSTISSSGSLDRTFSILDAGVSVPILKGLSADLSTRQTDFEISGDWDPTGSGAGVETSVTTTRNSGRVIWNPMRGVSIDLGGASITRKYKKTIREFETVTTDITGGFTYSRQSWFNLRLSHRAGDIENPYTRLSPTDRTSTRSTLNLMPLDWFTATLSYVSGTASRYYSRDETDPDSYFNARTSDVRSGTVGFSVKDLPALRGVDGYVGYTRGSLDMNIPIARSSPPFPAIFDYRDITYAVNGWLSYELKEGFILRADIQWYRTNGQWPLTRSIRQIGVMKDLGVLTVHADFRSFSLDQVVDDRDNYRGSLITVGLSRGF